MIKNIIFSLLLLITSSAQGFVVLIDPGHGGHELGAVSRIVVKGKNKKRKTIKVYEKDLCLKLAKKVKHILSKKFTVYLTRSFDRALGLDERAQMADSVKADLFISIHFNSGTKSEHNGFETYYLDNHDDTAVHKVEKLENKYLKGSQKVVNQILIDLVIKKTVVNSKKLAKSIHKRIKGKIEKRYKVKDRGIKAAQFYVLALSKRPGVLIEAGFMSNPKEIWKVRSNNYLNAYASAIAKGIDEYYDSLPKRKVPLF